MKYHLLLFFGGSILSFNLAFAQPVPLLPPDGYVLVKATNSLARFDLDFHGGTPKELITAIEKATRKPLNAVIPDEYKTMKLPALSVKNATVPQLFEALGQASAKNERHVWTDYTTPDRNPRDFYFEFRSSYGFKTEGRPTEDSVWYFYYDQPPVQVEPKVVRFYQLSPYLNSGYKVEDITTAIETGWKMLGVTNPPEMSYHKDTKVLIAVGGADKLKSIENVLKQLSIEKPEEKSNDKVPSQSKNQ